MSKAKANPFGELILQNIKESLMSVFSRPDAMKEFIDKAILGNGIMNNESNK